MQPNTYGRDIIVDARKHPVIYRDQIDAGKDKSYQVLEKALLESRPSHGWHLRLRQLLETHPQAWVGEFGLDRAAIIPETKVTP
jgi:hypothetical protein